MSRLGGVALKSHHRRFLHNSKRSSSRKVASRSFVSPFGSRVDVEVDRRFRWTPIPVSGDREGAEDIRNAKTALGLFGGVCLAALGVQELRKNPTFCDASELQTASSDENEDLGIRPGSKGYLLGDSYRREVFFNYERRIRMRSRPEKVFLYFASVIREGQAFMTPADLMRAVVPLFSPSDSEQVRGGYLRGERHPGELRCPPSKFFMLFDTNGDGLISFPEYIFLVTLLSIPEKNFSTAFKMFDLDGNGEIDREEFKVVMNRMRGNTRQGAAQRNGLHTGLKVSDSVENGGLVDLFFGSDGSKSLRHDDFKKFLEDLNEEIIRLEFLHYDTKSQGTISAHDFGLSMIAAADLTALTEYLGRANDLNKDTRFKDIRISHKEFHQFAEFRKKLPALALAVVSYGNMNKKDFQRAAATVCHVPLSDAVVEIIFYIFDSNQDGNLSSEEFLKVMERRETDIAHPTDTGLVHFFKCWWNCAQNCKSTHLQYN